MPNLNRMMRSLFTLVGLFTALAAAQHHARTCTSSSLRKRHGECKADAQCVSGECCSQYGYCGTGPDFCGAGGRSKIDGDNHDGSSVVSQHDANGSIFNFGDANACHQALRTSGACGLTTYFQNVDPDASVVAMPAGVFDLQGSYQNNKLCGKKITLTHEGVTRTAIVADRNLSGDNSIDMCLDLWTAFGGRDNDGTLLHGISFEIEL